MSAARPAEPSPAVSVQARVPVDASPAQVWRVLTDWPAQGAWMLATTVAVTGGDGRSVGSTLSARTGYRAFGFLDRMEITEWDPVRHRCVVRHTGHLVRGTGEFVVTPRTGWADADRAGATVCWIERLQPPFGWLGRAGWPLVAPAVTAGMWLSLRRLARLCPPGAGGADR